MDFPEDLGCMAAGDNDERIVCDFVDPVAVVPAGGGRVRLDLVEDVYDLSCGGAGSDAIVAFVVSAPSEVILRTDLVPGVTVISVLGACEGGAELGCKAGADGGFYTTLALPRLHPGVYFAVVSSTDGLVRSVTLEVEIFPLEPRACADGADNDLDGLIDALDRGCSSSLDDTETDEAVDEAPACANGLDDDGDGWVDHPMDPECQAAGALTEGGRCLDGRPVLEVSQAGGRFSAGFVNLRNVTPLWCEWEPGGELTVALTLESRSRLRVTVANRRGEAVPAAISVRTGCGEVGQPDDEVVCSSRFNDSLNVAELPAGTHFLLIQPTARAGADGDVDFEVESLETACSDLVDNDADGRTDADDVGCRADDDDDETDPANSPDCSDGVDNDGDDLVDDPNDPTCVSAGGRVEGPRCGPRVPVIELGVDTSVEVQLDRVDGVVFPDCIESFGAGAVVAFDVEVVSDVSFVLGGEGWDASPQLALLDDCAPGGVDLACTLAFDDGLSAYRLAPGTYLLYILYPQGAMRPTVELQVNREPVSASCNDARDNDGDGLADGIDNDEDGTIDFPDDDDCRARGGASEEKRCPAGTPVVEVGPAGGAFIADTAMGASLGTAECPIESVRFVAYAVRVEELSRLTVVADDQDFDGATLLLRSDCLEQNERACVPAYRPARLTAELEAGLHYVLVGSNASSDVAPFEVTIAVEALSPRSPSRCSKPASTTFSSTGTEGALGQPRSSSSSRLSSRTPRFEDLRADLWVRTGADAPRIDRDRPLERAD